MESANRRLAAAARLISYWYVGFQYPHFAPFVEMDATPHNVSWQEAMKRAVRDPLELCRLLRLPAGLEAAAVRAGLLFPLFAPHEFVARMRPGDPSDPLLRQVLPLAEEEIETPGFSADPLAESGAQAAPGLLHKYHGRALLIATGACAVHCRYCFRRHYPYEDAPKSLEQWAPALAELQRDESLREVLLSGGDPLTLSDATLERLIGRIADIRHIQRLRVHTRLPIVIPSRVCDALLRWLAGTRLRPVVVIHANHPRELDGHVAEATAKLRFCGVLLFNQSVLLRGVNDDADVLAELSERLIELGVTPYYLHQLDRVAGAAHFEVPVSRGKEIAEQLRMRLPGYAVPRYVREIPGEGGKRPL